MILFPVGRLLGEIGLFACFTKNVSEILGSAIMNLNFNVIVM